MRWAKLSAFSLMIRQILKIKKRRKKRKTTEKRKAPRFSKVVIASVLISVAAFTAAMTVVYCTMGGVPDTLVTAFFAFAGGEAGVLGFLKWGETKHGPANEESANSESDSEAVG